MSYALDNYDLKVLFKAAWDAAEVPVQFPGLDGLYTGEATPRITTNDTDRWARWTIAHNQAEQMDLNTNPQERLSGTMVVNLFGKVGVINNLQNTLLVYADELKTAFQYKDVNNFTFQSVSINDLGEDGNGWYVVTVKIPYFRYHQ